MTFNPADRHVSDDDLRTLCTDPPNIPRRALLSFMFDDGVNQKAIANLVRQLPTIYITTVQQEGLSGEKSDFVVLARARKLGCTLVMADAIAERMHRRLLRLGLDHAGINWVRDNTDPSRFVAFVKAIHEQIVEKDMAQMLRYGYWEA